MEFKKCRWISIFLIFLASLLSWPTYAEYFVAYGDSCARSARVHHRLHRYPHHYRAHFSSISVYAIWKTCPSCCCNDWSYNPDLATGDDDTVENPDMDIDE